MRDERVNAAREELEELARQMDDAVLELTKLRKRRQLVRARLVALKTDRRPPAPRRTPARTRDDVHDQDAAAPVADAAARDRRVGRPYPTLDERRGRRTA